MLYRFGRFIFAVYIRLVYRLRVHGRDNIPGKKPFIICSNHISLLDPLTVGIVFPARYRINYMAKKELFSNFLFSMALRRVGAFPVNRREADYGAIKKAFSLLNEGQVLGLFPEGSRSKNGSVQRAHNGAALIAVRSGVPVLPVAIAGPYRPGRALNVYIGRPFTLPSLEYEHKEEKKARLEELSLVIMESIKELIPRPAVN